MVASILEMAGLDWPVPDFSTLSRRQKTIAVQLSSRRAPGPLNLLVDSTGIKFLGDGEWLARTHGTHRRRQSRKAHLAMDTATGDIRVVAFTSSREGPSRGCAAQATVGQWTAPCSSIFWTRSRKTRKSAPLPVMAPSTRGCARSGLN